jgi:hypothetical protein
VTLSFQRIAKAYTEKSWMSLQEKKGLRLGHLSAFGLNLSHIDIDISLA